MAEFNGNQNELLKLSPDLYSRNKTIAFLLDSFGLQKPMHVLDVGGFGGRLGWFLSEGYKLIVVDQKPRDMADKSVGADNYIQADARKLPFPDNTFEAVVSSDLLEHVAREDRMKVVEELCRVSKNYVILGAPFKKDYIENVENMVAQQFLENTGIKHPFLDEHRKNGLPDEREIEMFFKEKGFASMAIGEGNIVNWALQQLSVGAKQGEKGADELTNFNEYFNRNLYELGNYQEPTYRTIFCVSKEKTLKSNAIVEGIAGMNKFLVKTFCYAMKIAFTEDRKMLNRRKKQLNTLADAMLSARDKVVELKDQNTELYSLLQERQHALTLLQANYQQKVSRLDTLEAERAMLASEISNAKTLIQKQDTQLKSSESELETLKHMVKKQEENLKKTSAVMNEKEAKLIETSASLTTYKSSYDALVNSRAWKAVMAYGKIKNVLVVKPWKLVRNGLGVLMHLGPKEFGKRVFRKVKSGPSDGKLPEQYQLYIEKNTLTSRELSRMMTEQEQFDYKPVISIVMPVYNVAEEYLVKAIASVKQQSYSRWELCLCDDASTMPYIRPLLQKYAKEDPRIRVVYRNKNGGIVKASNDALKIAQGAYVGLLDNDDELAPDALFEVVKALQENRYDLLYSDEDKLDMEGRRCEPFFKPDWSPDLLLSINYVSHFGVYRRKILSDIGGFREGFDGSQDYDLVLRFTEKTTSIRHITKILYHWRKIPGSTAENIQFKPYAMDSAKKALADALRRRHIEGEVTDGIWTGSYRVKRAIKAQPLVSIIIPFRDKKDVLETCLRSIFAKTTYPNYEILLVDNQSEMYETREYLKSLQGNEKVRILSYNKPFNYAAINNFAEKEANGEVLILLNNDTEVISPNWIEAMMEHAQRPEVGAVGAKLLYPNNTLQHAGVLVGVGGIANSAFYRHNNNDHGYFGQVDLIKNYSAVTAACVMVRKDVYGEMGGLDEQNLAVTFNDVDFCLRLREKGYLVIYTPYATLYHHESLSRGYDVNMKEIEYMQKKYGEFIRKGDPYYNPNLTCERLDFSLRCGDKLPMP